MGSLHDFDGFRERRIREQQIAAMVGAIIIIMAFCCGIWVAIKWNKRDD